MGRPPGAHSRNRRRAYLQNWELRDPYARYGQRFEELESDEEDGQGVILDKGDYARYAHSDAYDLGWDRIPRRGVYDDIGYDDYIAEDEEYFDQERAAYQAAIREKEESLLQSALDRIARARAKGKANVNLTQDEIEALERRNIQPPEPTSTLASPPPTPTPGKSKVKTSSRTSSGGSLAGQKKGKKGSGGLFGSPAKSNSKAKVQRKSPVEQAQPYPLGPAPPGIMVPGPNGVPVYAPIAYYRHSSPDFTRSRSGHGSRSSSKHSRRESTPPDFQQMSAARFYGNGVSVRPESQDSNRSLPDDIDWYPPPPSRTRSASNAQHRAYRPPPTDDYDMAPPMPAAQGRRHASGPPDVRYANLRRAPQSSSPLAQRNGTSSQVHGLRRVETSSSSSSDDQGVQVDIVPDEDGGYTVQGAPAAAAPAPANDKPTGNETRKRKGGRR